MPRPFVVVGESVAVVADFSDLFVEIDKLVGTALAEPSFEIFGALGDRALPARNTG